MRFSRLLPGESLRSVRELIAPHSGGSVPDRSLPLRSSHVRAFIELHSGGRVPDSFGPLRSRVTRSVSELHWAGRVPDMESFINVMLQQQAEST